ncbi:hypothetical protein E3N88_04965 [Mikania micrantha]|uniref:Uncharacterized protein n=1 Tax=Mikania micrantha TaxID=192012 RepID=A0A5N6PXD0_9ASTR|nr:hypothetical protein E3N88_04965 [Mikania micrantha]
MEKLVFAVRYGEVEGSSRFSSSSSFLSSQRRNQPSPSKIHHPTPQIYILKPLERLDCIRERLYESRSSFYPQNSVRLGNGSF